MRAAVLVRTPKSAQPKRLKAMRVPTRKAVSIQQTTSARPVVQGQARNRRGCELDSILRLQRNVGNEGVRRVLKLGLGNSTGSTAALLQPRLMLGVPGDVYEREADRVADIVMNATGPVGQDVGAGKAEIEPTPSVHGGGERNAAWKGFDDEDEPFKKSTVAEKCACDDDERQIRRKTQDPSGSSSADGAAIDSETGNQIHAMRGRGQSLTSSERRFMEHRFGADFSAIRIYTNSEADTHCRQLNARAFTLGSDVFFRASEYVPGNTNTRRLLAHELTHSIQQGAATLRAGQQIDIHHAGSGVLQRQAAAGGAPAPAPAGRAVLNFLPVIMDQVPAAWGVTVEDDAIIDITAFASDGNWKCVITTANQQARQGVQLLPGVVPVTPALVAGTASCATLNTMITSLNSVANQGPDSGFYMLAAVRAHENLHITQYRADLAPHYTILKTAIEALTIPLATAASAADAKAAIKALPAYTVAIDTFHAADVAANNKTAAHTAPASFNAIEHGIVDPMIVTIRSRKTALACP